MANEGKRKSTTLDTLPPVCGAALVTSFVMYPVDVVRAICMSNPGTGAGAALRGFLDAHGVMGFVKQGLAAEVTRATLSRGVKFFMFPICHQAIYGTPDTKGNPMSKGIAGAVATIPEVIAISPLENIKLAAQLDKEGKFKGTADITQHILKTRGFNGLMTGYAGMQVRNMLWFGWYFMTLDVFKGVTTPVIGAGLVTDIVAGFFAGATGVGVNCWTDVCRSIVQKQAIADTFDPSIPRPSALAPYNPVPFFGEVAKLHASKGVAGLYAGVGPKMVHLGGSGAILAVLMPRFKNRWFEMKGLY